MANVSKAVLVTGCSSGIGAATALRLVRGGWRVYASARQVGTLTGLKEAGCETLALDVNDEESRASAVVEVERREGAVGILVNNAGYGQSGAIATLPIDKLRAQFETNVVGLLRLTQLALPAMRRQGWGRVVNLSSMGGKLSFPGFGAYHASKHAVEALSDALRYESKKFGLDVIVIEPGFIRSAFNDTAASSLGSAADASDPFAAFDESVRYATSEFERTSPIARLGGSPEDVAAVVDRAIRAGRPRARYRVTASAAVFLALRRIVSDATWDRLMSASFPQPGPIMK
jgi:NAD(P)-dependent dehydrogenase (short-subunit alcohol dehydrogenase family)